MSEDIGERLAGRLQFGRGDRTMQQSVYDDSDWTDEEMAALAEEMFDEIDNPREIQ